MGADCSQLRTGLQSWAPRVAKEWGSEMAEAMRPEAPISTPTPTSTRPPGELRRSIRFDSITGGFSRWRARISAPVIQAATTDKGAKAHVIRARRAKVLRFWWADSPSGPGIYRYPRVNHPGNDPMDWWEPGLRKHAKETLRKAARRVRF